MDWILQLMDAYLDKFYFISVFIYLIYYYLILFTNLALMGSFLNLAQCLVLHVHLEPGARFHHLTIVPYVNWANILLLQALHVPLVLLDILVQLPFQMDPVLNVQCMNDYFYCYGINF